MSNSNFSRGLPSSRHLHNPLNRRLTRGVRKARELALLTKRTTREVIEDSIQRAHKANQISVFDVLKFKARKFLRRIY